MRKLLFLLVMRENVKFYESLMVDVGLRKGKRYCFRKKLAPKTTDGTAKADFSH